MRTNTGSRSGHAARTAAHNLQTQPHAIVVTAAVLVRARVDERRQELVDQISMRGMDFHHVESCRTRTLGRLSKGVNDRREVSDVKSARGTG